MKTKIIAFGDVHLHWKSAKIIFNYARDIKANTVITLGDEANKIFPFAIGKMEHYDYLYNEYIKFRNEENKQLICTAGDKTAGIPKELLHNFIGLNPKTGKIDNYVYFDNENKVLASHFGEYIKSEYEDLLKNYSGDKPLVIFHGHSHSMGILEKYKWLTDDEMRFYLENGEEKHNLEPGKIYWVNPGGNFERKNKHLFANFAVYNISERIITLKSIPYEDEEDYFNFDE